VGGAGSFLETLVAVWSKATPAERNELLGLVFETVADGPVCNQLLWWRMNRDTLCIGLQLDGLPASWYNAYCI